MIHLRRNFLKTTLVASAMGAAEQRATAQPAALFPGFERRKIQTSGATINALRGGKGPPLLLIHGYPQTHAEWHKIASELAKRFTVVLVDLRGYGDSSKPAEGENHVNYSKRAMALDQVEVMHALGYNRFAIVGHDRGARVAWRLAVEHAEHVTRAVVLDIVPLPYTMVTREFATQYFHWFFLIQPAPFPETLIGTTRSSISGRVFSGPRGEQEPLRPRRLPSTSAASRIPQRSMPPVRITAPARRSDIEHSNEDGAKKVVCPLLVLWGERGTVGRLYDVMKIWREHAVNVTGGPAGRSLPA
jgi:haloacetate dehalogenase